MRMVVGEEVEGSNSGSSGPSSSSSSSVMIAE